MCAHNILILHRKQMHIALHKSLFYKLLNLVVLVCINGWGMTRCHPLTFFKKQQEKDMNMKPVNSYK